MNFNLTRKEAFELIRNSREVKITHKGFLNDEYLHCPDGEDMVTEEGFIAFIDTYFGQPCFKDGWSVLQEDNIATTIASAISESIQLLTVQNPFNEKHQIPSRYDRT